MNFTGDFEHHPNIVPNTAYGIAHQDINTGLHGKESLNGARSDDPSIALQENDAYTLEEPVVTDDTYDYPAKVDPSSTIDTEQNEAYAMGITMEKNEAYKPVTVVNECDNEYDYI